MQRCPPSTNRITMFGLRGALTTEAAAAAAASMPQRARSHSMLWKGINAARGLLLALAVELNLTCSRAWVLCNRPCTSLSAARAASTKQPHGRDRAVAKGESII